MMQGHDIEIDGKNIFTLEDFCEQIWPLLSKTAASGTTNLDALNDILAWPTSPYTVIWRNSELSKRYLGHAEMVKKVSALCQSCHPSNAGHFLERLHRAESGQGPTMFDWLVEIIQRNEPYVTLKLQ